MRAVRGRRRAATARIANRATVWTCPWVRVIRKTVKMPGVGTAEYYSLKQPDYVNVFAVTAGKRAMLVRQFRPAIERHTWELPAGVREAGETARGAAARELREETGVRVIEMVDLGPSYVDTGRLQNRFHSFAAVVRAAKGGRQERGIEARLVTLSKLRKMILAGELSLQTHVGLVLNSLSNPKALRMFSRHGLGDIGRTFLET